MPTNDPLLHKYHSHKGRAKQRGIAFNLTFKQWVDIWKTSGQINNMGRRRGQFNMCRYNDKGAYEVGNVHIITHGQNLSEGHVGLVHSEQTRKRMAEASKRQRQPRSVVNGRWVKKQYL